MSKRAHEGEVNRLRGGRWLWVTDPHLDHLPRAGAAQEFGQSLRREHPDTEGLLITGDIGESKSVLRILDELSDGFAKPIYFVVGNHDYYGSSFAAVDARLRTRRSGARATWLRVDAQEEDSSDRRDLGEGLPESESRGVFIVGNSGWYDARNGDESTDLRITDFVAIEELFAAQDASRRELLALCRQRADQLADALVADLRRAARRARERGETDLLCLTHVPPFAEAAWYQGRGADERWSPFFSSQASGRALLHFAQEHPDLVVHVLCGHTHGAGCYQPSANLRVWTGAAEYGAPRVAGFVELDESGLSVHPHGSRHDGP